MILDILLLILTFVLDVSVSVGGFMIYKKKILIFSKSASDYFYFTCAVFCEDADEKTGNILNYTWK